MTCRFFRSVSLADQHSKISKKADARRLRDGPGRAAQPRRSGLLLKLLGQFRPAVVHSALADARQFAASLRVLSSLVLVVRFRSATEQPSHPLWQNTPNKVGGAMPNISESHTASGSSHFVAKNCVDWWGRKAVSSLVITKTDKRFGPKMN